MDKKKLKIVFLSRYLGTVNRGAETYVLELSKRLGKNHLVEVFTGTDSDNLIKIISGGFDLVIPTNGRLQALKTSFGRVLGGYKTLISGQAGIGRDDIWNITLTAPDIYVALTEAEFLWAKKWAWKTKIVKIPNGVDLDKFSPKGVKVNFNLTPPIILSVGALTWYKHHERVIQAVAKLESGSLVIIGSGPEKEKLQALGVKVLGKSHFLLLENIEYQDLPKYYRSANLFTLPSWEREAFGIVYIEAMASGLPVIAPDDLTRREIVGNGGFLVDVEDPEKYAAAILRALSEKWGNKPRKQAEKFSWDKVAQSYKKLFKEIF